jgi:hypothetical protein
MLPGWKLVAAPLVVAMSASPLSCRHTDAGAAAAGTVGPGGPAPVCEELQTGDFSTLVFGGPPPATGPFAVLGAPPPPPLPPGTGDNVKFLLGRSHPLATTAAGLEKELIDACTELGLAAGLAKSELEATPDAGHGAERACNAAATRVSTLFRKAKESRVLLDLQIEPMRCFVDADAARKCLADCGAPPKGDLRAHCVGGEITGLCAGRCSGTCALPPGAGNGTCHGACSGRCDREFRGTCGGKCTGTCDGAPTRGPKRCAGICDGTCNDKAEGVCIGRCDGQCSGAWEPPFQSSKCSGVCVGGCSGGEIQAPLCTGEYAPAGTDPVCQAACGAAAALTVQCEAPLVRVAVRGGKPTPEIQKLLAGVQSAIPKIVRVQQGAAKRLPRAIENVVAASVDWSNTFATAGKKPLFCLQSNNAALKEAATWIENARRATEAIAPAIKTDPIPTGGKPDDD